VDVIGFCLEDKVSRKFLAGIASLEFIKNCLKLTLEKPKGLEHIFKLLCLTFTAILF